MGSIQGFIKISLLALGLLSMATWVPQMFSFLRTLFMVYLPSLVSAVVAPKCLFLFSNIIVVILVGESKLGHPKAEENVAQVVEGDMVQEKEGEEVVVEAALAMPAITGEYDQCNNKLQDGEFIVQEEEVDALLVTEAVEMLDQPEEEGHDLVVREVVITDMLRKEEKGVDQLLFLEDEDVLTEEAPEEKDDLPPADELNRRVEEFIARFNMERQLEARMLVCCC